MINRGSAFVQAARGPVLLIVVGVLFALQQSGTLPFSRSWPLLIIVIGVMKLIERMVAPSVPPPPPGAYPGAPPYPPYRSGSQPGGPSGGQSL